ncbi:phosphatidate cytidylyltransferase [Actinospongicola halichondriae]|uniref:phosphatidate cytidylyltransferase n=1 Tax=Actinospongicola halichondriae TaxID=3236844 RepID=UPI003D5903D7
MTDDANPDEPRRPDPEGVRIIGADEAEAALERDDIARRRGPDDPRPGDRPRRPPADAPEPVLRFPLSSTAGDVEEPAPDLPHWSDPPTGEFGAIGGSLFDDEPAATSDSEWSALSSGAPRWRDGDDAWSDEQDVRTFGDDDTRIGALDESDRPDPEDFFSFDEIADPTPGRSVFDEGAPEEFYDDDAAEYYDDEIDDPGDPRKIVVGGGRVTPGAPARARGTAAAGVGGDRDIRQAAIVGVGLIAVAAILFILGPAWATILVVTVVTLAAAEFFTKVTELGYQPATLLGVVGTAGVVIGAYHRGEAAIPVAMFLMLAGSMLWFLIGAGKGQATLNIGVTLLGFVWVGVFGSFAAALLSVQGGEGVGYAGKGILFGAILATVGYDVGGYFVGRGIGTSTFSAASPNKTIEGLIGGFVCALSVGIIYGFLSEPLGTLGDGFVLGLTVAIVAPLGDLCQSMIKRDLGIKDMGSVLPGHGGLLDRFDALLFVLPAVYFSAKLSDFFL